MVYFITDGEYMKIGKADDITYRISMLQTSTYRDLDVVLVLEGGLDLERKFHSYFGNEHIKREWFDISKEKLLESIKNDFNVNVVEEDVWKITDSRMISIKRTDLDGKNEKIYPSIISASEDTGIDFAYIGKATKRKSHRAGQYRWYRI